MNSWQTIRLRASSVHSHRIAGGYCHNLTRAAHIAYKKWPGDVVRRGFTLIELLVVIAIIAILAAQLLSGNPVQEQMSLLV